MYSKKVKVTVSKASLVPLRQSLIHTLHVLSYLIKFDFSSPVVENYNSCHSVITHHFFDVTLGLVILFTQTFGDNFDNYSFLQPRPFRAVQISLEAGMVSNFILFPFYQSG